jgi:hypothetical protein
MTALVEASATKARKVVTMLLVADWCSTRPRAPNAIVKSMAVTAIAQITSMSVIPLSAALPVFLPAMVIPPKKKAAAEAAAWKS